LNAFGGHSIEDAIVLVSLAMHRFPTAAVVATAAFLAATDIARAEEHSIIKNPGEHPQYVFEAEPHLIIGFGDPFPGGGEPGIGFRGSFHLTDGFVKSINDSVAIGVGADFAGFGHDTYVAIPVVMQWNFWLSTRWSVFGEPGIQITNQHPNVGPALFLGGRYHFSDTVALTLRLGFPAISVGVSFFP
jgi:hypothetical protein